MRVIFQAMVSKHLSPLKNSEASLFVELVDSIDMVVVETALSVEDVANGISCFIENLKGNSSYIELLSLQHLGLTFQASVEYRFKDGSYKHHTLETLLIGMVSLKGEDFLQFAEDIFMVLSANWQKFYNEDMT